MKYSLLSIGTLAPLVSAVGPLVNLGYTQLQGVAQSQGITQWLGVRYAAPPVGQLRFRAPLDPLPTTGVVDATKVNTRLKRDAPYTHRDTVPEYLPGGQQVRLLQ